MKGLKINEDGSLGRCMEMGFEGLQQGGIQTHQKIEWKRRR